MNQDKFPNIVNIFICDCAWVEDCGSGGDDLIQSLI